MICRVALHEKPPGSVASDEARGFREWIKGLAGFVDGYHVQDSKTGRMLSITIWESEESMEALRRVMCNELDQQVSQVTQRSAEGIVDRLCASVRCDLRRQARQQPS